VSTANGGGALRRELEAAVARGWRLQDLAVLARQNDPFMRDTPAGHRDGHWFAEQMGRFAPRGAVHLRGLHYCLVAAADVLKPDGLPYRNTDEDWRWLQEHPAKCGRWLGYVPFARIVDERNAEPEVTVFERSRDRPAVGVSGGFCGIDVPDEDAVLPSVYCSRLAGDQPYRIILIGEKTSLGPVLRGLPGVAELQLPTGELTDTRIYEMAARANEDGRPAGRRLVLLRLRPRRAPDADLGVAQAASAKAARVPRVADRSSSRCTDPRSGGRA
jgi:hypothetical protein